MDLVTLILAACALAGLYTAWNIGANDVANAMGTSVGSGALTLRQALFVAAIFELAGALLAGGPVTETLSERLIDPTGLAQEPLLLAVGMTCCLLSASIWLHFATSFGWPVSTTQSVVGAVLGFGLWLGGSEGVQWAMLGRVALSWVISPLLGGLLAFQLIAFLKRFVLGVPDPVEALRRIGYPRWSSSSASPSASRRCVSACSLGSDGARARRSCSRQPWARSARWWHGCSWCRASLLGEHPGRAGRAALPLPPGADRLLRRVRPRLE
ncbi:MAG: anion permease [Polyangiales bacterium]